MRKALVVGIDHYDHGSSLHGCVNDAYAVKGVLERHGDGRNNFDVLTLMAGGPDSTVLRGELVDRIKELFRDDSEIALMYFAGHGHVEAVGGYLLTSEAERPDAGVSLNEIMAWANGSKAKDRVLILDSCHSGIAGERPGDSQSVLAEGMTVLAASAKDQYATEENGSGVFTSLLVDALAGAAANLVGQVSPGSVYAHIDQALGAWSQRPIFKTNVKRFISLRDVQPPISVEDLRRVPEFFPAPGDRFDLDPSFEEEMRGRPAGAAPPDPENVRIFKCLQRLNRVNVVVPDGAPYMWHAAIESQGCRLTVVGEHYHRLVNKGLV